MQKIVVVTGGGRGIGAATARLAAERGYALCVNYRKNQAAAEAIAAGIDAAGGSAIAIGADVRVGAGGIRANGVRAGIIHTGIHADGGDPHRVDRLGPTLPMRRGGDPIEVARAIMWLLSDEASYSTGTCIDVAGGR